MASLISASSQAHQLCFFSFFSPFSSSSLSDAWKISIPKTQLHLSCMPCTPNHITAVPLHCPSSTFSPWADRQQVSPRVGSLSHGWQMSQFNPKTLHYSIKTLVQAVLQAKACQSRASQQEEGSGGGGGGERGGARRTGGLQPLGSPPAQRRRHTTPLPCQIPKSNDLC